MRSWQRQHSQFQADGLDRRDLGQWRKRYLDLGLEGMHDALRPGGPAALRITTRITNPCQCLRQARPEASVRSRRSATSSGSCSTHPTKQSCFSLTRKRKSGPWIAPSHSYLWGLLSMGSGRCRRCHPRLPQRRHRLTVSHPERNQRFGDHRVQIQAPAPGVPELPTADRQGSPTRARRAEIIVNPCTQQKALELGASKSCLLSEACQHAGRSILETEHLWPVGGPRTLRSEPQQLTSSRHEAWAEVRCGRWSRTTVGSGGCCTHGIHA